MEGREGGGKEGEKKERSKIKKTNSVWKMIAPLTLVNHLGILEKKQRQATSALAFACVPELMLSILWGFWP